jgi:hypothetical protein
MGACISSLYIRAHIVYKCMILEEFEVEEEINGASCRSSWFPAGYICNHVVESHGR